MSDTSSHSLPSPKRQPRDVQSNRRRYDRDTPKGEPSRAHLTALILGTYAEIPGLCLDDCEAARLFGLREGTCRVVLKDLVRDGRLTCTADGRYRKR